MLITSCKQIDISDFFDTRFDTNARVLQKDIDSQHFPDRIVNQNIDFLVLRILDSPNADDNIAKLAYLLTYSDTLHSNLLIESIFIDHLFHLIIDSSSTKVLLQIILIYFKILKQIQMHDRKYFHFGFYSLIIQIIPEFSNYMIISDIFFPLLKRLLKCYPFIIDRIFNDIDIIMLIRSYIRDKQSSELISCFSLLKTLILLSPAQYIQYLLDLFTDILNNCDFCKNCIPKNMLECLNELMKRSDKSDITYLPIVLSIYEKRIDILYYFEISSELLLQSITDGSLLLQNDYNREEIQKVLDIYSNFIKIMTNEDFSAYPKSFKFLYQLIPICSENLFTNLNNFIKNSMKSTFHQKKMRIKLILMMFHNFKLFFPQTIDEILDIFQSGHYLSIIIYTFHEMVHVEEYKQLIKESNAQEILLSMRDNYNVNDDHLVREIIDLLA